MSFNQSAPRSIPLKMYLLLRSLVRNESITVTNKTLMKDIDGNPLAAYLDIFKRLFITDNQPPFSAGIRSSVQAKQMETLKFLFEALCQRNL